MREKLKEINGLRFRFRAVFVRFGVKNGWKGGSEQTALFNDVHDMRGNQMCDHIWFTVGKQMASLNLEEGDSIEFDARVTPYLKGYRGHRERFDYYDSKPVERDYRLSNPTRIIKTTVPKITHSDEPSRSAQLPLFEASQESGSCSS